MTRSHGTTGLIRSGSPFIRAIASRIAARSTTHGTPVKSCRTTRAGMNGTSLLRAAGRAPGGQVADVALGYESAAGVPQRILEQHPNGEGKPVEVGESLAGELGEPEDGGGLVAEPKSASGVEWIGGIGGHGRLRLMVGVRREVYR